nr:MAG TPA: hypothetical protein [Caudoviricetes sp.]
MCCPADTGEHLTDQQPECTSRAILNILSRPIPGRLLFYLNHERW